jgi:hypothetical protein
MNFAMNLAYQIEERLSQVDQHEGWTDDKEENAYQEVLDAVVKEDGRAWAAGNIRMGELILISCSITYAVAAGDKGLFVGYVPYLDSGDLM